MENFYRRAIWISSLPANRRTAHIMKWHLSSRVCVPLSLALLLSAAPALARFRAPQPNPALKPNRPPVRPAARPALKNPQREEHLQQWMENHKSLPLHEQIHALENEPGFKLYPPQTQQRFRDELVRLNSMPPQQRDRTIARTEILEKMSPPQRQQYRNAVQSFATMPPDRRRLMARAVIDLREMPPPQRDSVIESDRFRGQFSDGERSTLKDLLSVEPYPGARAATEGP
jgi:hypothetical protein